MCFSMCISYLSFPILYKVSGKVQQANLSQPAICKQVLNIDPMRKEVIGLGQCTLIQEVASSNPHVATVVPIGEALYHHCLVLQERFKAQPCGCVLSSILFPVVKINRNQIIYLRSCCSSVDKTTDSHL